MHEGIARLAELYPNCFRQPGQPLKIGIHNDVIARHPELQPGLIASALRTYTRSVGYLKTLKAGAVRIDLEGNPVGHGCRSTIRPGCSHAPADNSGRTTTSRVGWTQGGRTGSPGEARRREVIQALWLARSRAACRSEQIARLWDSDPSSDCI